MVLNRQSIFMTVAALGLVAAFSGAVAPATAASGGAKFCIASSGTSGENAYTSSCIFSDYQQCLQATAGSRGNCVGNIDYREGEAASPVTRHRRAR